MLHGFSHWCAAFDASDFPPNHPAIPILQINRGMLSILLSVDIAMGEMAWDCHLAQFQSLLDFAESISLNEYEVSSQRNAPPTLHYHLGLLTPLYLVCTRCRDTLTRRRGLRILENQNSKEGIWDSIVCTKISKQTMEIEESSATEAMSENGIGPKPGGWVVESAEQIPEKFRVRVCIMKFGVERERVIKYK